MWLQSVQVRNRSTHFKFLNRRHVNPQTPESSHIPRWNQAGAKLQSIQWIQLPPRESLAGHFSIANPSISAQPSAGGTGGKKVHQCTSPHHPAQQQDAIKRPGVVSRWWIELSRGVIVRKMFSTLSTPPVRNLSRDCSAGFLVERVDWNPVWWTIDWHRIGRIVGGH